ncbi:MAG: tetratricopeptide repeat-containing sensor histidine kinase [Bacteroidales bacterium]|nr:tetratricopeptide repeat-containing sensor histidine kinase [Bacteroidales bacterium]
MIRLSDSVIAKCDEDLPYPCLLRAYELKGLGNYYLGIYDIAAEYFLKTMQAGEMLNDSIAIGRTLNHLAMVYKDIGDTSSAITFSTQALQLFRRIHQKPEEANSLNILGSLNLYYNIHRASEYYRQSLAIRKELNDSLGVAASYNNLGIVYQQSNMFDSALFYYKLALELYNTLDTNHYIAVALSNIGVVNGMIYNDLEKLKYLNRSLELSRETGHYRGVINTLINLAQHYYEKQDFLRSRQYLEEALGIAEEKKIHEFKLRLYRYFSELYSAGGDYVNAYSFQKKFSDLKDSLHTDNRSRIAGLQLRYLNERNERDRQLRNLEVQRQKNQKLFFLIVSLLVAIIALLVYSRYLIRSRSARMLEEKNTELEKINRMLAESEQKLRGLNATKDKFFSILAHDLKNPLGTIRSILDYMKDYYSDFTQEQLKEYLEVIDGSMKSTYSLLENLLTWSLSQSGVMEFRPVPVDISAMTADTCRLCGLMAEKKNVRIVHEVVQGIVVMADPEMIGTVLRNLIGNAVKFTYPGTEVRISSKLSDDEVIISVKDQGAGLSPGDIGKLFRIDTDTRKIGSETPGSDGFREAKGTGLGLILCHEFISRLGGRIWVESEPGKGCAFSISLKAAKLTE